MHLVTYLLYDDSHTAYLTDKLEQRIMSQQDSFECSRDDLFVSKGTLRSTLEKDYVIAQGARIGTVSQAVIAQTAKLGDRTAPWDLLELATQFPMQRKPTAEFCIKGVCTLLIDERNQECGFRLKKFIEVGGIKPDGTIDMRKMCYRPIYGPDGYVTRIVHISGATVAPNCKISKDYRIKNAFSDFSAVFWQKGFRGPKVTSPPHPGPRALASGPGPEARGRSLGPGPGA